MLKFTIAHLSLVLLILSFFPTDSQAKELEIVIIKNANFRSGPGTNYKIIGNLGIGEKLKVVSTKDSWYEAVKGRRNLAVTGWVSSTIAVANNDSAYAGKGLILLNVDLTSKLGKNAVWVASVKQGDIVTILKSQPTGSKIQLDNGKIGWVRRNFIKQIGFQNYPYYLNEKSIIYSAFNFLDKLRTKNEFFKYFVIVISVVFFILPLYFIHFFTNFLCVRKALSNTLIKWLIRFLGIVVMLLVTPIFMFTPPYENFFIGVVFVILLLFDMWLQGKRIVYLRCPRCRTMWAGMDKGSIFLGGWKSKRTVRHADGSTTGSTHSAMYYRDKRECNHCGHRWSITRVKS